MLTHSLQAGMQGKGDREIGTKPYLILGTRVPVIYYRHRTTGRLPLLVCVLIVVVYTCVY